MHSFVGNKAVAARTTAADLRKFTATTCRPAQDLSGYWVPTLYDDATGQPVETTGFRVYYRSLMSSSANQMPMPNGLRMISGNHKDHVRHGWNNTCPASHPVKIPAITFDIQYGAKGTTAGYHLSSDKDGKSASSMHGDAFVMWDPATMNQRTRNCIAQRRTCDNDGYQR